MSHVFCVLGFTFGVHNLRRWLFLETFGSLESD